MSHSSRPAGRSASEFSVRDAPSIAGGGHAGSDLNEMLRGLECAEDMPPPWFAALLDRLDQPREDRDAR